MADTRFKPGQTGNPGGRSKIDKRFRDAWKAYEGGTGADGIEKAANLLAEIAFSAKETSRNRLEALRLWLAYACGKPKETVEIIDGPVSEGPSLESLMDQLDERGLDALDVVLAQVEARRKPTVEGTTTEH